MPLSCPLYVLNNSGLAHKYKFYFLCRAVSEHSPVTALLISLL